MPGQWALEETSRPLNREVDPLKLTNSHRTHDAFKVSDLTEAKQRLEQLRPIMALPEGQRHAAIKALSEREGVSVRTVYRWLREFERKGIRALGRRRRRDKGGLRIPPMAQEHIIAAFANNPPTTSVAMIYRTLMRAVPEAMSYRTRRGRMRKVSQASVLRVRRRMEQDPVLRLIFFDGDDKKEFFRTHAGKVISNHANDLWQGDFTRCDVMVLFTDESHTWPEGFKPQHIGRPRIFSWIDVYSGVIPGLAFSRRENQAQVNLSVLRAMRPKAGPYGEKHPYYGIPKRVMVDNGKVYSEHFTSYMSRFGVEVMHGLPYASHVRGKKERFYGSLHNYERSLPGYCGKDAAHRSKETLLKLYRATVRWVQSGKDPGWGNRLLTIDEYQNLVLAWLIAEYHQWVVDSGKSRHEHWLESAKEHPGRLIEVDLHETLLLMGERHKRVVQGGVVRFRNRFYWVPGGRLGRFEKQQVLVITDDVLLGPDTLWLAVETPHGSVEFIGEGEPAAEDALSPEAKAQRAQTKADRRAAWEQMEAIREGAMDFTYRVPEQLMREAVVIQPHLPDVRPARGQLAAANPTDPRDELPDDEFTRFILAPPDYGTDDPAEIIKRAKERRKGVNRG